MSDYSNPLFRKLDRIPAAPNFVRYNFEELQRTLKAYVAFAKGMPTISYVEGLKIIKDLVLGLIDTAQAMKAAEFLRESPSKEVLVEFVEAFCRYAETRQYVATPAYAEFSTSFPIARDLFIPVKPTLVAREGGQLKPIFVFGWKSVPLTLFQRRLLMTILEDAIFSLTDFESSDAEIVFLPEVDGTRIAEVWHRGDYELLSQAELKDQIELFLAARTMAYPLIAEWLFSKGSKPAESPGTYEDSRQIRLDLPTPPSPQGK
jgi:hypothetical protein